VSRTALASGGAGLALAAFGGLLAIGALLMIPTFGVVISLCAALVAVIAFGGAGVQWQLGRARGTHPDEAVEGVRSVLRVLVLFALVTPFWSLFDQKASTWVLQADLMSKPSWFQSSQMQALNPALVMLLIPFNNLVLFPAFKRFGYEMTALRRMTIGIVSSGLSWVVVGGMQLVLDGGQAFSIAWQVLPYALLTLGEVLVSATGLEFAYSQAPHSMKGVLMSFWLLAVTVGNLWVLVVNAGVKNATVTAMIASTGFGVTAVQMFFFAAFAFAAALVFGLRARSYQVVDHYRKTG
jgi:POT family proton-dependent oligopeptide transporter